VSRLSDPGAAFTNEFLPGEGPKPDDSGTSAGGSGF
jgi:hypothetical protein